MRSLIERVRSGTDQFGSDGKAKAIAGRERNGETTDVLPDVNPMARARETIPEDRFGAALEQSTRQKRNTLYPVIALALAVVMAGVGLWGWLRPAPSQGVVRYALVVDSAETIVKGGPWSGRIALSPDGSRLAYIGGPTSQLLIRARNQLHATAIAGTEGANTPFFSPDGSQVGFLRETQVQIASMNGGLPTTVTDTLTGVAGASWGPDGFIYADGSLGTSLLRFEAKAGAVPKWFTVLDTAGGEVDHTWPDVLPNGKGVLFTVQFSRRNAGKTRNSYSIAVAEIPSGKHRVIVNDAMYARYASSGHLLYVTTQRTLMVVPFDQSSMKVTGEPTALMDDMRLGAWGSADLAVSATGTLVYATGEGQGKYELVWVTRDGKTQPVDPDWQGAYVAFPSISPDGKRLAVSRRANDESINIWVKELDRGSNVQVTTAGQENYSPAWTPDGRSVTFSSNAVADAFELWTKPADGSSQAVLQAHEKRSLFGARWSADGKWLIFQSDPGLPGAGDILGIQPGIDSAPVPVVVTKFTELAPALSPDGRWLAYTSNETGKYEIYVVPFPNTAAAKWAVSTSGGTEPLWSHRGSELFYRDAFANLVASEVKTKPTFSLGRSVALFPAAGFAASRFIAQYAVASDDRRFLMIRSVASSTPDKLIVVENWFEELNAKRR
jgi:serine/threonine-protein kinase